MTDDNTIDRPIKGDISRNYRSTVEQLGKDEFLAAIDKLLALDGVTAVRWTQYTPYFNDGDACYFGLNEITVQIEGDDEDFEGDYGYGFRSSWELNSYMDKFPKPVYPTARYGTPERREQDEAYRTDSTNYYSDANREYKVNGFDTTEIAAAINTIEWHKFSNVAEDNFGDHAQVTATPEGFTVEYYEHD